MLSPEFWNSYFSVYDTLNASPVYSELLETIAKEADIHPGMSVLDAGVGTGNLVPKIEAYGGKVTGIDFSPEALALCARKNPNAQCLQHDLTKPLSNFADNTFDRIVSNNTLYNIPRSQRGNVFRELYRVLKPGGKIVVSNVHEKFRPWRIYLRTITLSNRKSGPLQTVSLVLKLAVPTAKIFYYNHLVQKAYKKDARNLFSQEEQSENLRASGFREISMTKFVFGGQGVLNSAKK